MTLLNILHYPDNKLRQKGHNVDTFDEKLEKIAIDMLETMYQSKGIGLAAVQVNLPISCLKSTYPSPRAGHLNRKQSSA